MVIISTNLSNISYFKEYDSAYKSKSKIEVYIYICDFY